jgi:hypothetical protein
MIVAGSDDSCLNSTTPAGTVGGSQYVPGLVVADVRSSSSMSTSDGSPSIGTIPGGRVTPTGPTSPPTASSIPTSNMSSIASASTTGPVDGDAGNSGFALEISCCMFTFGTLVGIAGANFLAT